MIRVAAAAYPLDRPASFADWAAKQAAWIGEAAGTGAHLVVFPEYAGLELAGIAGPVPEDLVAAAAMAAPYLPQAQAHLSALAAAHRVTVLAGSLPEQIPAGVVNRARLFAPEGRHAAQDKLILTPWERCPGGLVAGTGLSVFDTPTGRLGVSICYDAEFPLIGRALCAAGAQILLVPAATDTLHGQSRVRIGAQARALEGQIVAVHAPLVGPAPWCAPVDVSHGTAAIYAPPDLGLPPSGVLACGPDDGPGWAVADLDLDLLARVRRGGDVRLARDWTEQPRDPEVRCHALDGPAAG